MNTKICLKCKIEKENADFSPSQLKINNGKCRACVSINNKKWVKENPAKNAAKNKKYRENNPEKEVLKHKKWVKENPEKNAAKSKKWIEENPGKAAIIKNKHYKKRYHNDPIFRAHELASSTINQHIKLYGRSKNNNSINNFLPWVWQEYKVHIENQFESWMTWNNQGSYDSKTWDDNDPNTWTWQLDHIIPHSTFHYASMDSQEFRDCWALSNLRPLNAKQNVLDGVRRIRHKKYSYISLKEYFDEYNNFLKD